MAVLGPQNESYAEFYSAWINQQEQQLQDLQSALASGMREEEFVQLVSAVRQHYREYYDAKESAAKQNVLQMISPSWRTPLENAFLWLGGWRPTMVFQLAYAEVGCRMDCELAELLDGIDTPSMASLTSHQLSRINDMQMKTQEQEEELTHRMAVLQQAMADQPLLTLAQIKVAGENLKGAEERGEKGSNTMGAAVTDKVKSLEALMIDADSLRYNTLEQMLEVLTPFQAAQYLLAAGQLQKAIRQIGQKL